MLCDETHTSHLDVMLLKTQSPRQELLIDPARMPCSHTTKGGAGRPPNGAHRLRKPPGWEGLGQPRGDGGSGCPGRGRVTIYRLPRPALCSCLCAASPDGTRTLISAGDLG